MALRGKMNSQNLENVEPSRVWAVAHTSPYGTSLACADLKEFGFEVFAPKILTIEARHFSRRKMLNRPVERPLFPGYLFVAWPTGSDGWGKIVSARGVLDLVRSCGKHSAPSLVPQTVMAALLAAGEILDLTKDAKADAAPAFAVGDVVTIDNPAFCGELWQIARLDHRSRIRFILHSLKPGFREFELKASASSLKAASA